MHSDPARRTRRSPPTLRPQSGAGWVSHQPGHDLNLHNLGIFLDRAAPYEVSIGHRPDTPTPELGWPRRSVATTRSHRSALTPLRPLTPVPGDELPR